MKNFSGVIFWRPLKLHGPAQERRNNGQDLRVRNRMATQAKLTSPSCSRYRMNRDFKILYGKALVRRQIVTITSGDLMTRVPVRLSRRSLVFYYGKVPGFTYSSLREYKPAVYFLF